MWELYILVPCNVVSKESAWISKLPKVYLQGFRNKAANRCHFTDIYKYTLFISNYKGKHIILDL